jgi:hypothetical protein
MVRPDWSAGEEFDRVLPDEGMYQVIVLACEEKQSSSGKPTFNVEFGRSPSGKHLCWDTLTLAGKGWGIAKAKLKMLKFSEANVDIEARDLVGRKCRVYIKHDTFQGKNGPRTTAKVDIYQGEHCGYFPFEEDKLDKLAQDMITEAPEGADPDRVPF